MRPLLVLAFFLLAHPLSAEKVSFADVRFTLDIPADWKKSEGPRDGNILHREAPGGEGSFSVFTYKVKKDHRVDLAGTLKSRVEAMAEAGMQIAANRVEGQDGAIDGKKALFAVVPIRATVAGEKVRFNYNIVLIDAKDMVVILQATMRSPAPKGLQKTALEIIQSFKERERD